MLWRKRIHNNSLLVRSRIWNKSCGAEFKNHGSLAYACNLDLSSITRFISQHYYNPEKLSWKPQPQGPSQNAGTSCMSIPGLGRKLKFAWSIAWKDSPYITLTWSITTSISSLSHVKHQTCRFRLVLFLAENLFA